MNNQNSRYTLSTFIVTGLVLATILVIASRIWAKNTSSETEMKQNILTSLHINSDAGNAERLFDEYITASYTLNTKGEKQSGADPLRISLRAEMRKEPSDRRLPAFEARKGDSMFIVIPVYGKGLWGPIWGYISFYKENQMMNGVPHYNTIYGVMFDHKKETDGRGAEINQSGFRNRFIGKKIFNHQGKFVSVKVVKGGADPASPYQVDAISGGTLTCKGLEAMLDSCLVSYQGFFMSDN